MMSCDSLVCDVFLLFVCPASKNMAGKSREELALEKQLELERRLMDVSGQLNSGKKPPKTKRKLSTLLFKIQTQHKTAETAGVISKLTTFLLFGELLGEDRRSNVVLWLLWDDDTEDMLDVYSRL